ncbi:MAG: MFS transporter, partial [Candidatus Latescibacteria bacterium]|nr:MFS transporter [Candidatus Latescibacterota bacterium]
MCIEFSFTKSLEFSILLRTFTYYASFIALGLVVASLGPTLPGLADRVGVPLSQISFLFATRSGGYLVGTLLGGRLFDRLPAHPVLCLVLLLMAGAMAAVPGAGVLWLLAGVLLLVGIAEGTLDVGVNTSLVRNHPENLGPYMNGLHFFFGVGAFLSPIVVAQAMVYGGGIDGAYWLLAFCIVPVALVILKLPSPDIQADHLSGNGTQHGLFIFLIAACFFVCVGAEVGIGGWIYTYAVKQGIADAKVAAYLTSCFWGALTLGRLIAIPVATRVRPRTVLLVDILGAGVSVVIMFMFPLSVIAIWVGTIGTGLFVASMFATLLAFAGRRLVITGRVMGWFFVGSSLGAMTVPWLI